MLLWTVMVFTAIILARILSRNGRLKHLCWSTKVGIVHCLHVEWCFHCNGITCEVRWTMYVYDSTLIFLFGPSNIDNLYTWLNNICSNRKMDYGVILGHYCSINRSAPNVKIIAISKHWLQFPLYCFSEKDIETGNIHNKCQGNKDDVLWLKYDARL